MIKKTRINTSAKGTLDVMFALRGHSLNGLTNTDLSKSLNMIPSTVNRCLNTLIEAGFATKLDTGRYALSVRMLQIAQAHAHEITRAQGRIDELTQRVSAGAHIQD